MSYFLDGPYYGTSSMGGARVRNYGAPDRGLTRADRVALEREYDVRATHDEHGNPTGNPQLREAQMIAHLSPYRNQ